MLIKKKLINLQSILLTIKTFKMKKNQTKLELLSLANVDVLSSAEANMIKGGCGRRRRTRAHRSRRGCHRTHRSTCSSSSSSGGCGTPPPPVPVPVP